MRNLWLPITLFFLALTVQAGAVEYNAGPAIQLSVRTEAQTVTVGQPVRIEITADDVDYVLARDRTIQEQPRDPVSVTWQASGGSLQLMSTTTARPILLNWLSPAKPGYYAIFITATDSGKFAKDAPQRKMIEISVTQPGVQVVPSVRIGANPQTIQLDKNAATTITAQLLGKNVAGKDVTFYATAGTLSAARVTADANGLATVRLTATAQDIGTADVAAYYENTTATTRIEIVERVPHPRPPDQKPTPAPIPPYQPAFMVAVDPPTLPADGESSAIVTVRLTDARGLGILGQIVDFTITQGRIEPRSMTDRNGYARVRLFAPPLPAEALILVQAGALRSYGTVSFVTQQQKNPTGPARLFLTVAPSNVMADGASKVLVTVLALDSDGYALENTPIDFSSTLGTVQYPRVLTTQDGQAGTYLLASTTPGLAVVTARLGKITAASQVVFQGVAGSGAKLDIRNWSGQSTTFVNEKWLYRQMQIENGQQGAVKNTLIVLDDAGNIAKQIDTGKDAVLITDQYGVTRGYGTEADGKARLDILKPDGSVLRSVSMNLPVGSHLTEIQYAEPAGQLLVGIAKPDGSGPEVSFFSSAGQPLFNMRDGLEQMPVMALTGDGYAALALAGGSVRLYSPLGQLVSEARRTDGLQATQIAVGPTGEWVAVASALAGQTEVAPRLQVFSRQGTPLLNTEMDIQRLAPAGKDGVLVSTPENTRYISLATRMVAWTLAGGFERFIEANGTGVIAGLRDPQTKALISRIIVFRVSDGKIFGDQTFKDFRGITAVTPPDAAGLFGVITQDYVLRFPVPAEK